VQPAQASSKLGASVALTATVTAGDSEDLGWLVYPSDAGKVVFDPNDPAKATYTAPPTMPNSNLLRVVAYLVDDEAAGLGSAVITISS
jgi:hypothetical protein